MKAIIERIIIKQASLLPFAVLEFNGLIDASASEIDLSEAP